MKKDYAYCLNKGSCIHRRGCKRWLGNYNYEEVKECSDAEIFYEVNDKECVPNYKDVDCKNGFGMLDRFRFSDGRVSQ